MAQIREPNRLDHAAHVLEDGGFGGRRGYARVEFGDGKAGLLLIEMCTTCGHVTTAACQHETNTWNDAGTKLTCDLCGADGT